jgi:hypothetical protein
MNLGSLLRGFNSSTVELHIAFTGAGSGFVTRTPPDLVCSGECKEIYNKGSMVSLIAAPAENSVFEGWSGDVQGTEFACSIAMDSAKKVVANFSRLAQEKRIGNFLDYGDGTVSDTRTGLMWKRFTEGQDWLDGHCEGVTNRFTLDQAKAINPNFAGYNDWRLPTLDELKSIIDKSRGGSAFDPAIFTGFEKVSYLFWTSSTASGERSSQPRPWFVSFYSGASLQDNDPLSMHAVRLVRNQNPKILAADSKLAEIASQRIAPESATEWSGTGFEFLLREVERADEPSAILIKALAKQPEIVSRSIGRLNRTLLHHAAAHHKLKTVQYLCLVCHADINSVDKDGETPLDYALAVKATPVMDYLRALGAKSRKDTNEAKLNVLTLINTGAILKIETVGAGEVVVSPKRDSYELGTRVAIVVTPSTGWRFKGWSGYLNSNTQKCLIVMDTDKQITAHFELLSMPVVLDQRLENVVGAEKNLIFAVEDVAEISPKTAANTFETSEILQRLVVLEAGLSDVLLRLAKLESAPPELIKNTENIALTVTSLSQVLAWLVTQERVPIAGLRERLLPLDQFPGAFIDEINEKALDLVGDLALEEIGDEIIVTKEVCFQVIENLE